MVTRLLAANATTNGTNATSGLNATLGATTGGAEAAVVAAGGGMQSVWEILGIFVLLVGIAALGYVCSCRTKAGIALDGCLHARRQVKELRHAVHVIMDEEAAAKEKRRLGA